MLSFQQDIKLLRTKLRDSGIIDAADLVKTEVKGDGEFQKLNTLFERYFRIVHIFWTNFNSELLISPAFMLMLSHAALVCNAILYFPDIMHSVVKNNLDLETNFKWVIHFSVEAKLTQSKVHLKLFDLVGKQKPQYLPDDLLIDTFNFNFIFNLYRLSKKLELFRRNQTTRIPSRITNRQQQRQLPLRRNRGSVLNADLACIVVAESFDLTTATCDS